MKPHSNVVVLPCSCSVCTTCIETSGHPTLPRCLYCLNFFNEQERIYLRTNVSKQVKSVTEYSPYCLKCYKTVELACKCACTDHADKQGESCEICKTVFTRQSSPQHVMKQNQHQIPIQSQFQMPQTEQNQYQSQFQMPQTEQNQYQTPIQSQFQMSQTPAYPIRSQLQMSQFNQYQRMNSYMPSFPTSQIILCYKCGVFCLCYLICGQCLLCKSCLESNAKRCPTCEIAYTAIHIQQLNYIFSG